MPERRYTVVALAGGELEADFRNAGYDVPNKAYLDVGGVTMLERVLRALRNSAEIGRIVCVTPPDAFAKAFPDERRTLCDDIVAPGADVVDSILAGFRGVDRREMVMVAATDLPLASAADFTAFARRAVAVECDVGYGFVRREAHAAKYPQVRHTWVHLREGTFCGGGVSIVRAGAVASTAALVRKFAAARKSPLRLAGLFSPLLALRLVFGSVGIAELEQRADSLSGLRCRGIACDEAELAVNVDRLEDLRCVEAIIAAQGGPITR